MLFEVWVWKLENTLNGNEKFSYYWKLEFLILLKSIDLKIKTHSEYFYSLYKSIDQKAPSFSHHWWEIFCSIDWSSMKQPNYLILYIKTLSLYFSHDFIQFLLCFNYFTIFYPDHDITVCKWSDILLTGPFNRSFKLSTKKCLIPNKRAKKLCIG